MNNKIVTIKDATEKWVGEFNAVSSSLIERAFKDDIDNWSELTPIVAGNNVYYNGEWVDVVEVRYDKSYDGIEFNSSKIVLDVCEKETTFLSEKDIDAVYVSNERLEVIDYDFENNLFILENDVKINFEDVKEISYLGNDATVLNIEKYEDDDDFELEIELNHKVVDYYDVEVERYGWLPMWGTLWTFGEDLDVDWARNNPEILAECGFRIFEDYETGDIYIGIDGAGYNFYEAHWIPLYKARGLQWHDTTDEVLA